MNSEHTLKMTNEFAPGYDSYIADKDWSGPKELFALLKPFIKQDDLLLDIGIGTGLASIPFKNAGLKIYGIDGSEEMIKLCNEKNITEEIILSDISKQGWQLPDLRFNFIISNAVFHMIGNIDYIASIVYKHLIPGGYFCFTTFPLESENTTDFNETEIAGIYSKRNNDTGLVVYRHLNDYVTQILIKNNFRLLSSHIFMGFVDNMENRKEFFEIYLAQKVI